MAKRDFISIHDLTKDQAESLFQLGAEIKANPGKFSQALSQKSLGMIFQKSSTRTRVSFEVGMTQLGGHALFLSANDIQLGRGETVSDTAHVLGRFVDCIMARTFAHQDVLDLATHASVPVINGLTDDLHPCQGMADFMTLREVFDDDLAGRKIAYVGDGNNVAHSLLFGAAKAGMNIAIAAPAGYDVNERYLSQARADAEAAGIEIVLTHDPVEAATDASAIYTDVWTSMGQEDEARKRLQDFEGFTVNESLMSHARGEAVFLHCLPAHRGEEVSAGVADGPQSRIFDQAENRMHIQKAILVWLLDAG